MLSLMVEGPRHIEHWSDRGQSSDIKGDLAILLFLALCTAAAVLRSAALATGVKRSAS